MPKTLLPSSYLTATDTPYTHLLKTSITFTRRNNHHLTQLRFFLPDRINIPSCTPSSPRKRWSARHMDEILSLQNDSSTIERLTGRFASNEFTWLILCTSARMGKEDTWQRAIRMEILYQKDALDILSVKPLGSPSRDNYGVGGCISVLWKTLLRYW